MMLLPDGELVHKRLIQQTLHFVDLGMFLSVFLSVFYVFLNRPKMLIIQISIL